MAEGVEHSERFRRAIAAFDAANAEDPNRELVDGVARPKELVYGERMSAWLARLYPEASEALRLAARSQHLRRWEVPRASYPPGRVGYLRWRTDLKRRHAELAGAILRRVGYDEEMIARVGALLRKEGLRRDPEAQALEDVACLVFLAHYFADFAAQHPEDKVIDILRKTWRKMSPRARAAARRLSLPAAAGRLLARALAEPPPAG